VGESASIDDDDVDDRRPTTTTTNEAMGCATADAVCM
jgi:hypothetical protein